jgi:hypothetical protein
MRKIKALKKFINPETQEDVSKDDVLTVSNNTAHTLIDNNLAKLYAPRDNKREYKDKMMTPKVSKKRGYNIK